MSNFKHIYNETWRNATKGKHLGNTSTLTKKCAIITAGPVEVQVQHAVTHLNYNGMIRVSNTLYHPDLLQNSNRSRPEHVYILVHENE